MQQESLNYYGKFLCVISKGLQQSHDCNTQPYLPALWTEHNAFDKEPFLEAPPDISGVRMPRPT